MKILKSLPFKLLVGVFLGVVIGLVANEGLMQFIISINHILGQFIAFCVPLIILGFVTPSITKLGKGATRMLGVALVIAYVSTLCAALLSMVSGYVLIPMFSIQNSVEGLKELPKMIFELNIPPIMSVMSALIAAIIIGLAAVWTKAEKVSALLLEFHEIVIAIVNKVMIPILPIFIASTFSSLAYEGSITKQLPVFLVVIIIVMLGHFIWLSVLYLIAGIYSKKNPLEVVKHYPPAYMTAVGTMSSAATLGVALSSARKSSVLRKDMVDFGIPLFANIHLCGSVLTEVFFVMTISKLLYGEIPPLATMLQFCVLLGIFAVGAPGVPGGTVVASLGLITSVLGFNEVGTALVLTVFALQDSFGTACNITGDGALTLIMSAYADKQDKKKAKQNAVSSRT